MQQVNVFIETSSRFRGNVERKCGYVLSTQLRTGKETREHFGRVTGTYHQAILLTMVDALDHMTRSRQGQADCICQTGGCRRKA